MRIFYPRYHNILCFNGIILLGYKFKLKKNNCGKTRSAVHVPVSDLTGWREMTQNHIKYFPTASPY